MLAVALESLVKLFAFLARRRLRASTHCSVAFRTSCAPSASGPPSSRCSRTASTRQTWITVTLLSFCAILLLPRQFHVTVVENRHPDEVKTAAWMFPLYLIAINLFVVPIAAAGLMLASQRAADTFVLALPASQDADFVTLAAFSVASRRRPPWSSSIPSRWPS